MGILKRAVRQLLGRDAEHSIVNPTSDTVDAAVVRMTIKESFSHSASRGGLRNHDRAAAQLEAAEAIHGHDFAP
jgi:hypothetical protein